MGRSSPLARTVDLDPVRNATDGRVAARFHPVYGPALARLPVGPPGVPRPAVRPRAGPGRGALDPARRADRRSTCPPAAARPATSSSPTCATPGATMPASGPPGSPWATSSRSASRSRATPWSTGRGGRRAGSSGAGSRSTTGSSAGGRRRSPRSRMSPTRSSTGAVRTRPRCPAGTRRPASPGSLTIMPGHVRRRARPACRTSCPSATDDALLWLHAIELEAGAEPVALQLEPLAGGRPGSDVLVAAVTLFAGSRPTRWLRSPGFAVRVERPRRALPGGRPRDDHPDPPAPTLRRAGRTRRLRSWAGAHRARRPMAPRRRRASSTLRSRPTPSSVSMAGTSPAGTLLAGGHLRDPPAVGSIEVLPRRERTRRGGDRRPRDRRAGARPGAFHGRRRSLPAAGGSPRRGQPGLLRGHRGRPHPRLVGVRLRARPVRDRAAGRGRGCRGRRRLRPTSRIAPASRSSRRRAGSSCRSTAPSTCTPGGGSPRTRTSTSSPRRPPSSRPPPRTSTW